MRKLATVMFAALLGLSFVTTSAMADASKGQKLYQKKLKKVCGFNGAKFASKHTQDEWEEIFEEGKFEDEIQNLCPAYKKGYLKPGQLQHIYDFAYEYASDSGNVPSC
ncbi:MAG: cytochrome C [Epsilonproteobacteria bacterium]|nr:cytochrome C [Campylobacterota bacterium]